MEINNEELKSIIKSEIIQYFSTQMEEVYKNITKIINDRLTVDQEEAEKIEELRRVELEKSQDMKMQTNVIVDEEFTSFVNTLKDEYFEAEMTDNEELIEDIKLRYQEFIEEYNERQMEEE